MKVGLVNIALELFSNKKFNSVKNVIDMGTKEMRVSLINSNMPLIKQILNLMKKNSKN